MSKSKAKKAASKVKPEAEPIVAASEPIESPAVFESLEDIKDVSENEIIEVVADIEPSKESDAPISDPCPPPKHELESPEMLQKLLLSLPIDLIPAYLADAKGKPGTIEFVKHNKDEIKLAFNSLCDTLSKLVESLPKDAFSVGSIRNLIGEIKRQYEVLEYQCLRI